MLRDIIDDTTSLGFDYFNEGEGEDIGYLRSLLRNPKSYEKLSNILSDDISLANELKYKRPNFGILLPYLEEAFFEVKKQIDIRNKTREQEKNVVEREIFDLQKDLKKGIITKDEYDFGVKMLNKQKEDDLSYLKNKFQEIDSKLRNEIKKITKSFDDEYEDKFDKEYKEPSEEELMDIENEKDNDEYFESKQYRFWTIDEYSKIYEDMQAQKNAQQKQKDQYKTPQQKQIQLQNQQLRNKKINTIIQKKRKDGKNMNPKDFDDFSDEDLDSLLND